MYLNFRLYGDLVNVTVEHYFNGEFLKFLTFSNQEFGILLLKPQHIQKDHVDVHNNYNEYPKQQVSKSPRHNNQ